MCADSSRRYHRDDGKPDRDYAGEHCRVEKHKTAEGEEEERETGQGTRRLVLQRDRQVKQSHGKEKEQKTHIRQ